MKRESCTGVFAELIVDAFQSQPVPMYWKLKTATHRVASFGVRSIAVEVDFEQREDCCPRHVGFTISGANLQDQSHLALALRVFNGVYQAVREFLATRAPEAVVFVAKDEDLAEVYRLYFKRDRNLIEALGYVLERPRVTSPYTEWTLRRVTPSTWR